ncbi:SDR family oxidoreductase [Aquamicrobium segne]|uniref:SDR family oxidoreductase n=1 Tax=Aquamicrobium segne TaxID=469547 RepID=A0ABW0GVE1_9HYPH
MNESGAVALVTGGAKRIGRAIVEDLCAHGFAVAVHSNSSLAQADELVANIVGQGRRASAFKADLTDTDQTKKLLEDVTTAMGPVQLLINNASLFKNDSLPDCDGPDCDGPDCDGPDCDGPDIDRSDFGGDDFFKKLDLGGQDWDDHFSVHVKAPVLLAQGMARNLPANAEGLVVNMIDQRVWRLTPRYFSYTLSKSALWTATRTMAQALAPKIRVNAIGPGPTLRNMRQDEDDFRQQVDALLLQRGPDLSEFGATIRYLWQARSVTGQMIALDGGQHLAWKTPDIAGVLE